MRPFTIRAAFRSSPHTSFAVIMGVLMFLDALIISLIRGTPRVMSKKKVKKAYSHVGTIENCNPLQKEFL